MQTDDELETAILAELPRHAAPRGLLRVPRNVLDTQATVASSARMSLLSLLLIPPAAYALAFWRRHRHMQRRFAAVMAEAQWEPPPLALSAAIVAPLPPAPPRTRLVDELALATELATGDEPTYVREPTPLPRRDTPPSTTYASPTDALSVFDLVNAPTSIDTPVGHGGHFGGGGASGDW